VLDGQSCSLRHLRQSVHCKIKKQRAGRVSMDNLTAKQTQVLRFIGQWLRTDDQPPTIAEAAMEMDVSGGTMRQYFLALERKGLLQHPEGTRSYSLTPEGYAAVERLPPPPVAIVPSGLVACVQAYLDACDAFKRVPSDNPEKRVRLAQRTQELREQMRCELAKLR
jgi:DNA-binding MarR family transcriptional regulator